MGCSASRLDTIISKAIEDPSSSTTSSSSSSSSSAYSSNKSSAFSSSANSSSVVGPKTRSLSAPLVHHPALKKGDTHHLVCLTSSTYGSLVVVDNDSSPVECADGFSGGSSPDSVINTWELMEGLEEEENVIFSKDNVSFNDVDDGGVIVDCGSDIKMKPLSLCDYKAAQKMPISRLGDNMADFGVESRLKTMKLFDFRDAHRMSALAKAKLGDSFVFVGMPGEIVEEKEGECTKPLWKHLSEEALLSKMDANVGNSYERALSGQTRMVGSKKLEGGQTRMVGSKSVGSSPFVSKNKSLGSNAAPVLSKLGGKGEDSCRLVGGEDKVVLYFTSLRGIRKTFEDCCSVRMILRGCRVVVDERDISMDSSFRKELQGALGGKAMSLPQLFVGGKHIGGADEIKLLHENGELEGLFDGFPTKESAFVCKSCGDVRFIPCLNCNGSRKVFLEEEGRTRRCPGCNENGLVRCPGCCL